MKIKKVTVLGSGVMGSGIAAHLANSGFQDINLLDIVFPKLTEAQIKKGYSLDDKNIRNLIARKNLNALLKSKPAQLGSSKLVKYITIGNTEDDFEKCIQESDWVIEVVPEVVKIKNDTFKKIDACRKENTIVTSNTSGISIDQMLDGCSDSLKEHFMVTHFFNPVRYMKLLELVKGEQTKQEVVDIIQKIGEEKLGKGIVHGYDVPAFVGNRIGVYNLMFLMNLIGEYDIETINNTFDKKLGYGGKPFSTCDLVGLDTLVHVVDNIYDNIDDGSREIFEVPEFLRKMVKEGKLGRKSGAGFFKREKVKGKNIDYVIDPKTGEYVEKKNPELGSLKEAKKAKGLEAAIKTMYDGTDRGAEIYKKTVNAVINYSFARANEISPEGIEGVDKAIKLGFNQKVGPGEILNIIGVDKVVKEIEKEDVAWLLKELHKTGKDKVYFQNEHKTDFVFDQGKNFRKIERPTKYCTFKEIAKNCPKVMQKVGGGNLYALGNDVMAFEMTSKNGTITREILDALQEAMEITKDYRGLIIGNDLDNFSFGANLDMMLGYILRGKTKMLEEVIRDFQYLNHDLKFAQFPVVVAKRGMALGGGCELGYGAHIRAAHDSFIGLVELGVGLIPGGGGVKETLVRKYNKHVEKGEINPLAYVQEAFEQIVMAKVAMSAHEAKELGYLSKDDGISMNSDFLLYDAKQDVIRLSDNYQPPAETKVFLPGWDIKSALYTGIELFSAADQLPPKKVPGFIKEHFKLVTKTLADVVTGGDSISPPGKYVTEKELLDMERKGFMRLTTEASMKEKFCFLQIAAATLKKPWQTWAYNSIKDSYRRKK